MSKSVQIPMELFKDLISYHLYGEKYNNQGRELWSSIQDGLNYKLDALARHFWFTLYKTTPGEAEREKARQMYLDVAGILPAYRWTLEQIHANRAAIEAYEAKLEAENAAPPPTPLTKGDAEQNAANR